MNQNTEWLWHAVEGLGWIVAVGYLLFIILALVALEQTRKK